MFLIYLFFGHTPKVLKVMSKLQNLKENLVGDGDLHQQKERKKHSQVCPSEQNATFQLMSRIKYTR